MSEKVKKAMQPLQQHIKTMRFNIDQKQREIDKLIVQKEQMMTDMLEVERTADRMEDTLNKTMT